MLRRLLTIALAVLLVLAACVARWYLPDAASGRQMWGLLELARFVNPEGLKSIGKNLYIDTDASGRGWWEGDESMWIDGEAKASIQGTGTEDYFGGAWGFRQEYAMADHGVSYLEKVAGRADWQAGKYTLYRFHRRDPIPFRRSFKISIERGHNNHRRDSAYSSVAYWYQE